MGKVSGTTILDGLHGELAEERARRGRRAGRQDRDNEDDPPNPRGKSRLDDVWSGRRR